MCALKSEPDVRPGRRGTVCFIIAAEAWNQYVSMACVAAASTRRVHPDWRIVLLSDERTRDRLVRHDARLARFFDEHVSVAVDLDSPKDRSRFLKTSMRRWLEGDFVFLDVDTLTIRDLSPLLAGSSPVGMALDWNRDPGVVPDLTVARPLYARLGWGPPPRFHFNSGVIAVRDDTRTGALFERWHDRWLETRAAGHTNDQPALNMAVRELELEVELLEPRWNAMVVYFPRLWPRCAVAHFFATHQVSPTLLLHLVAGFDREGTIDWAAFDRGLADGHPWGPEAAPWQLWRSRKYGRAAVAKARKLLANSWGR